MPTLTVIAGPNGSGKSTITASLDFDGRLNLLDPDAVARRLDPADPRRAAITAGREVILRTRDYLDKRTSFALETTLASKATFETLREARRLGFAVRFFYIALDQPERNIRRVKERVASGGHDVPDDDVRRRYLRSLAHAPEAIRLSHVATVYDNSSDEHTKMLEVRDGVITWRAERHPQWVLDIERALEGAASTSA